MQPASPPDQAELKALIRDFLLCTQTAAALSAKLVRVNDRLQRLLVNSGIMGPEEIYSEDLLSSQTQSRAPAPIKREMTPSRKVSIPTTQTPAPSPTPSPSPAVPPQKSAPQRKKPRTSGVDYILEDFQQFLFEVQSGKELANELGKVRDRLIDTSSSGFHPAFHEMGRWVSRVAKYKNIDPETRTELVEKLRDWRHRLQE